MAELDNWPAVTDDSGTKQDGTIFNKTLTDAMKGAIEDVVHSALNPTESAADIIDEVVAARGSKASLDARLDVSLNEDGTPKTNAANFSTASYQLGLGARNVVNNGDMYDWNAALTSVNCWTKNGAGATLARAGFLQADATTLGAGMWCAKLTRVGTDCNLSQDIIPVPDLVSAGASINDYTEVRGRTVAMAAKVKSSTVNAARITLDDGITTASSSYHTGGGSVEHLTTTLSISNTATKVTALLRVQNTNSAAYFGGVAVVFAEVAPSDWQPLSVTPPASSTVQGSVSVSQQEMAGQKIFLEQPYFRPGASTAGIGFTLSSVVGCPGLTCIAAGIGNVLGGEDDLLAVVLPGALLNDDGLSGVRITAGWTGAANGNNKTVKVYFGATAVLTSSTAAHNAEVGRAVVEVYRTSATAQLAIGNLRWGATDDLVIKTTPAETLSGSIIVKITGTSGAGVSNDVLGFYLMVEVIKSGIA